MISTTIVVLNAKETISNRLVEWLARRILRGTHSGRYRL